MSVGGRVRVGVRVRVRVRIRVIFPIPRCHCRVQACAAVSEDHDAFGTLEVVQGRGEVCRPCRESGRRGIADGVPPRDDDDDDDDVC